jgi:hypothetical protein
MADGQKQKRGLQCHFGLTRRKLRPPQANTVSPDLTQSEIPTDPLAVASSSQTLVGHKLYVDYILEDSKTGGRRTDVSMFEVRISNALSNARYDWFAYIRLTEVS